MTKIIQRLVTFEIDCFRAPVSFMYGRCTPLRDYYVMTNEIYKMLTNFVVGINGKRKRKRSDSVL